MPGWPFSRSGGRLVSLSCLGIPMANANGLRTQRLEGENGVVCLGAVELVDSLAE